MGGSEDRRKITWIDWQDVCSKKESGGLGARKLKEFNVALLGKWCWRILVDREGLWYHVLVACYCEIGGSWRLGAEVVLLGGGRLGGFVRVLAMWGVVGSAVVCLERWGMVLIHCFGHIGGLVMFLLVSGFVGCLT